MDSLTQIYTMVDDNLQAVHTTRDTGHRSDFPTRPVEGVGDRTTHRLVGGWAEGGSI